jgi:hypothetical protein
MTAYTPRIVVGGVALDDYAYQITNRTGWDNTAGLVGSNLKVPGRDGEIWQAKDYGTGRMVLDLLVNGKDSAGVIPAGSTESETFRNNIDKLLSLFSFRAGTLLVKKFMEDGSERWNYGEVGAVITPEYYGDNNTATMTVELVFPDPLWFDAIPTSALPAGSASIRTITLSAFAGMTAPITDPVLLFVGPAANPYVEDTVSGARILYSGTLAAGQTWRINCKTFKSEVGNLGYSPNPETFTGTPTNVLAATTYSPGPRFFQLTPDWTTLTPSINIGGTGFASTTTCQVHGNKRFIA